MTIKSRIGGIGTGKSLLLIQEDIIPALRSGRHVYTNVPIDPVMLGVVFELDREIKIDDKPVRPIDRLHIYKSKNECESGVSELCELFDSSTTTPFMGALLAWDELQDDFRAEETSSSNPEHRKRRIRFVDWVSKCRHYGTDFVWTSQDRLLVDPAVRRLNQFEYQYTLPIYPWEKDTLHYRIYQVHEGEPNKALGATSEHKFKKDTNIFGCYRSFYNAGAGKIGTGLGIPVKLRKHLAYMAVVIGLGGYFFWGATQDPKSVIYPMIPSFLKVSPTKSVNPGSTKTVNPTTTTKVENHETVRIIPQSDSVSVAGYLCVNGNCDLYNGQGDYLRTVEKFDSARKTSVILGR